jgi:hypothetical protein
MMSRSVSCVMLELVASLTTMVPQAVPWNTVLLAALMGIGVMARMLVGRLQSGVKQREVLAGP